MNLFWEYDDRDYALCNTWVQITFDLIHVVC